MQGQRRAPTSGRLEPRSGISGGPDVNRERLVFCITSLVGHWVTAKLRNNVIYEGLFHSCSLDTDYSITLKWAKRLILDGSGERSTESVNTLVIPGKDFLQVSAVNLPPPSLMGDGDRQAKKGFATDTEISRGNVVTERELVPWADQSVPPIAVSRDIGEDGDRHDPHWDQFRANEQMYGVSSTFAEDLYTTKLDVSTIPKEKRELAERIAAEIERGQSHAEVEGRVDANADDAEARFSDVTRALAAGGGHGMKEQSAAKAAPAPLSVIPQHPKGREPVQHDALSGLAGEGLARGIKSKQGMISEMKRINALNLEPTLPKVDDGSRNTRFSVKEASVRNSSRLSQGSGDLKQEFQNSLEVIQKQEASRRVKQQAASGDMSARSGMMPLPVGSQQMQGVQSAGYPSGGGHQPPEGTKPFSFNPQAQSFKLNPAAGEFTPGGSSTGSVAASVAAASAPAAKPSGPRPALAIEKKNPKFLRSSLGEILEPFFERGKAEKAERHTPDWPEAKGPIWKHEVLGQPNPASRMPMMTGASGGASAPQQGGWQQQNLAPEQGPPAPNQAAPMMGGGAMAPQMMQQGQVLAFAPPGGGPPQMYQQMYAAPTGGPGNQGGGVGGGMPAQGQQQQALVFGNQTMMPPQQGNMGTMGKFGGPHGQMVVMPVMMAGPGGQYQQGFTAMQGQMQGQPGQQTLTGPQGALGPQGQDGSNQQGQMMQQPMYHQRGNG